MKKEKEFLAIWVLAFLLASIIITISQPTNHVQSPKGYVASEVRYVFYGKGNTTKTANLTLPNNTKAIYYVEYPLLPIGTKVLHINITCAKATIMITYDIYATQNFQHSEQHNTLSWCYDNGKDGIIKGDYILTISAPEYINSWSFLIMDKGLGCFTSSWSWNITK